MYITSLLFLLGAVGALAIGFFQNGVLLIFISIGASLIAAMFLFVGMIRTRAIRGATAGAPFEPPPPIEQLPPMPMAEEAQTATAVEAVAPAPAPAQMSGAQEPAAAPSEETEVPEIEAPPELAPVEEASTPARAAKAPPTGRSRARAKKPAGKVAAKRTAPDRFMVTESGKFHRASCRFVKGKGLESMSRAAAESDGYTACGVCKP